MKIGIMTWHQYYNYGTTLQLYALFKTLYNFGQEPYVINYHARKPGKNGSTFNRTRREVFCGPWTCLNGNRLSHKISTDSYIWWLFYMDLLACRALLGPHRHLQSSFQSDPRTRGEMIMFQAMQVFSSILPSRDFLQYVIWLHPLSTEQIFEGWRKRTQSYFLKGDYLLAENSYQGTDIS